MLAVNISDMAAMGATPKWVLLSAGLPELDENWLKRFCDSFFSLAQRFGITLIGGDTTKGDLVFNVTIIGELPQGQALRRDAAKDGDDIWVSGQIGSAAAALNCGAEYGVYMMPIRGKDKATIFPKSLELGMDACDVFVGMTTASGAAIYNNHLKELINQKKLR